MGANKNGQRIMCSVICTPNTGHPVLGVHIDIEPTSRRFIFCMPSGHANAPTASSLSQVPVGCTIWPSDNRCIRTPRTRATLKFLWRMSRKNPARKIPNPSDFKAAFAAVHNYHLCIFRKRNHCGRMLYIVSNWYGSDCKTFPFEITIIVSPSLICDS